MDHKKPSVLLRIGCKQVSHLTDRTFFSRDGKIQSACAVGMMVVASTGSVDADVCFGAEPKLTRWLNTLYCPYTERPLADYIVERNDTHKLSPEQIANNLENMGF